MNLEPGAGANPGQPGAAQATAAIPDDPQTADLLRRHNAGEPLTPAEYGKLSWIGRKVSGFFGKARPAPEQAQPGGGPGNAVALATVSPGATPNNGLVPPDVDEGLCRRTASALLERGDAFAVGWIERESKASGATAESLDRFRAAAGLSRDDKRLLVEISPDICRELGIDPRKFCVWTAVGVLGFHAVNLWQCVGELKAMRKEKPATAATAASQEPRVPAPHVLPAAAPKPALGAVEGKKS